MQVLPMTLINPLKVHFKTSQNLANFLSVVCLTTNNLTNIKFRLKETNSSAKVKELTTSEVKKKCLLGIFSGKEIPINSTHDFLLEEAATFWISRGIGVFNGLSLTSVCDIFGLPPIATHEFESLCRTYLNYLEK